MDTVALLSAAAALLAGWLLGRSAGRRSATVEVIRLGAALEHERRTSSERLARAAVESATMRESFQALAAQALDRNARAFLDLAEGRLRTARVEAAGDLDARRQAVEHVVLPLREHLAKVERQLGDVERQRASAYAALHEQVGAMRSTSEQLRVETAQLVTALRAPQVRGRWGELQLRRVVEAAGMVEHCDFDEQPTSATADGVLRPDLVVRLAGGKSVVVDAKVPFGGFLEALEARDEQTRAKRMAAHARHLRGHVDALAAKAYWERFEPSPEFVVLFVPAEAFLSAALEEDPSLYEHAFARNVVLATPNNLIALLRTVGYAWRQDALADNAREVSRLGRQLYGRLATMGDHLGRLGGSLTAAVTAYNKAVGSLESRVLVTARRLADLDVADGDLPSPAQVDKLPTLLAAPELLVGPADAVVPLSTGSSGHSRAGPQPERGTA